jgi:hypothetical protein
VKIWEPRRLTTLWASTVYYKVSFTFTIVFRYAVGPTHPYIQWVPATASTAKKGADMTIGRNPLQWLRIVAEKLHYLIRRRGKSSGKITPVRSWLNPIPWRRMVQWRYSSISRDLGIRGRWVVYLKFLPLYSRRNSLRYLLQSRLGESQSRWTIFVPLGNRTWPIQLVSRLCNRATTCFNGVVFN